MQIRECNKTMIHTFEISIRTVISNLSSELSYFDIWNLIKKNPNTEPVYQY